MEKELKVELKAACGELAIAVAKLLWVICVVALLPVWNGYVLSIIWGWFAVPIFNAPPLSIPSAIGISIIAGYLTKQYISASNDSFGKIALFSVIKPALALFTGWIVQHWM